VVILVELTEETMDEVIQEVVKVLEVEMMVAEEATTIVEEEEEPITTAIITTAEEEVITAEEAIIVGTVIMAGEITMTVEGEDNSIIN
jgi:hypothetical protein